MNDEIEYKYVKGKGWVAGYKKDDRTLPAFTVTFTIITDANGRQRYVFDQPPTDDFTEYVLNEDAITLTFE